LKNKDLFLKHVAQTSDFPLGLDIVKAEGNYLIDKDNKKYLDLISGISVNNLGHLHPHIIDSVKKQLDKFLHVMVYGEFVQEPQVLFAKLLTDNLPDNLNSVYFVNSGSEATEGALKLAKRVSRKNEIITFKNSYHGNTAGALSVTGQEVLKNSFRPLIPGVKQLDFNNIDQLKSINQNTACVIVEPIQGEAGGIVGDFQFLKQLRKKCDDTDTILIFDEIQTGFGRTGKLFAFQHYNIVPDILLLGKAFGGGLPLAAFISDKKLMDELKTDPMLGHITTFGGIRFVVLRARPVLNCY
jgi:acetylornithine/succinyldiaminopimelate/putrescine aminotransferase